MTKVKSVWCCAECGHQVAKWCGRCPSCEQWNTLHEETVAPTGSARFVAQQTHQARPIRLAEITPREQPRHLTQIEEFDRLVGGGLVVGSLSLIAGDPGVGKSTLLLQISDALERRGCKVLYVCGEESLEQAHGRAKRLGLASENLYFLNETQLPHILAQVDQIKPDALVVDSIQVVYKPELSSSPGSVTQVRESTTELMHLAKSRGLTTILVGHVTKGGDIAGPRVLEHLVDTVLYFEGDRQQDLRLLRAVKNRFGSTDEIALFQMGGTGLRQVPNPSEMFLQERGENPPGSVIIPTVEGSRPILVEVQALVSATAYPNPSRRSTGLDQNRLALLLAVLEKRLRFRLHACDVFVSVAGGLKILEPPIDLAVLLAIASSFCDQAISNDVVVVGEVGLAGEIRSSAKMDSRIKEAARMGFAQILIPKGNVRGISDSLRGEIEIRGVSSVEEAIGALIKTE